MTTRLKKLAKQIPTTREAAETMVRETIAAQLEAETLIAQRDKARASADLPYVEGITAATNVMARNLELLEAYSEQHRDDFGAAKSITIAGHRMGWKLGNWKTSLLGKTKWADVLAGIRDWAESTGVSKLQRSMWSRWVRIKEEVNKEIMVADRDDDERKPLLKELGVEIVQEETFYLAPDREGQEPALMTAPV